jgi:hypothetical protein
MWRWVAALFALVMWVIVAIVIGATNASAMEIKVQNAPVMCEVDKHKIPCAYLIALVRQLRSDKVCTMQVCPKQI